MFFVKRLVIAILIATIPTLSFADVVVSYHETLQRTQLSTTEKTAQSFGPQSASVAATSLKFDAFGQSFDLRLQNNARVATALEFNESASNVQVLRGELADKPGSWARIVVFDGMPRGIIFDGNEMFAIEAPGDSAISADAPVIYRVADMHIPAGSMSCGVDSLAGDAGSVVKEIATSSKAAVARGPGAVSEITLSAIGDYEFTNAKGGDAAAEAALMTRLNNVDGYFSEQVGVQITVPEPVETHSDSNDPFTDTIVSDELLDEVSEYRFQNSVHSSQGLTHMWTGRTLAGTTVGVAWRGTLCDTYFGAGLSEGNESAFFDSLIAAHEIGHNFGAEHDGEAGTACENDVGMFIMSPSVNGSENFSQCSIDVMQAEAASARCVSALPTVDVGIKPGDQGGRVFLGVESTIEYEVSSNGLINAQGVAAEFTLPGFMQFDSATTTLGTCTSGAGSVDCGLGELAGQSVQRISLTMTPTGYGTGTLSSTVSTTDPDERASNDQFNLQLVVEDPVDLVANTPTAGSVNINQTATINATVDNDSDTDATAVTLSVTLQNGIRADSATWSVGTCVVTPQQIDCTADLLAARSTSDLSVTATALSGGRRDVTLAVNASEADANSANNTVVGEVVVNNPNGGGGGGGDGGGGGAVNPLILLLATLALPALRRRKKIFLA